MKNIVKSYLKSCVPSFQMEQGGSRWAPAWGSQHPVLAPARGL